MSSGPARESRSSIRLLREHGLAPKRAFGQCFLQDEALAARIAALATDPPGGAVLEIGAGVGALTAPLLERAARVVAIERDRDLVPLLRKRFGAAPGLELYEADAVKVDWLAALAVGPAPRVVAGNLPYQLTGRLVEKGVLLGARIDRIVFMVQREVAERLVAPAGAPERGAMGVFAQAAFDIAIALRVPAGVFVPVPRVDSAVVVMTPTAVPRAREDAAFRELVHRAFAQRRKQLANAWKGVGGWSVGELARAAAGAGIDLTARGETLSVEQFAGMAERLRAGPLLAKINAHRD